MFTVHSDLSELIYNVIQGKKKIRDSMLCTIKTI